MDYCVLGTNNMEASTKFYDSLFEKTELNQVLSTERMTFWQCEDFAFAIAKPFDEEPASNGNGTSCRYGRNSWFFFFRRPDHSTDLGCFDCCCSG